MPLILNESDFDELCEQVPTPQPDNLVLEDFEEFMTIPEHLGRGYNREMELSSGVYLVLLNYEFNQDLILKTPVHDHLIQVMVLLSGKLYFDDVHPNLGETRSYFSGSGVSPAIAEKFTQEERVIEVSVEIEPELLKSVFLNDRQQLDSLKSLFQEDDWKVAFYPTMTPEIRSITHQIWNTPYCGAAKRLYLQAKVFELLAIYLDLIAGTSKQQQCSLRLKPETITALHHVREILATQLEHPPSILELAQQVGMSDRTLQRGFKALFGTTVVGYSMRQRLNYAEHLLRQGDRTVAEVARLAGYGQLKYFAAIFKRQFGITPSECLAGKKSVL